MTVLADLPPDRVTGGHPSELSEEPVASPTVTSLERFLSALFASEDLVELRLIEVYEDAMGKKQSEFVGRKYLKREAIVRHFNSLSAMNRSKRANGFFGVCPRPKEGDGRKHHVRTVRVLWADLDNCAVADALERCESAGLPQPSVIVASGHGVHVYWILAEPIVIPASGRLIKHDKKGKPVFDLSPEGHRIEGLIRNIHLALGRKIGGAGADAVHDLSRILRLPGFLNVKNARNGHEPVPCELVECEPGRRYSLDTFAEWLPALERGEDHAAREPSHHRGRDRTQMQKELIEQVVSRLDQAVDDRSERDFGVLCSLIELGLGRQETWKLVRNKSKFADRGEEYFEQTWKAATAKTQPRSHTATHGSSISSGAAGSTFSSQEFTGPFGFVLTLSAPPRRTPARLTIPCDIKREGRTISSLRFTDSQRSISETARNIADLEPELPSGVGKAIRRWLNDVVVQVTAELRAADTRNSSIIQKTMLELVHDHAAQSFALKFRNANGDAWSEKFGRWIARHGFIAQTPQDLIDKLSQAPDAPRDSDSRIKTASLVAQTTRLMGVAWATILQTLPVQDEAADLGKNSKAASEFRRCLIRLWTATRSFVVLNPGDLEYKPGSAARASLVSRAAYFAKSCLGGNRESGRWARIQTGYDAWWRVGHITLAAGECHAKLWLAMRYTVADQIGIALPGATSQRALTTLATAYGLRADGDDSPPDKLSGGKERLFALSRELTDELLAEPIEPHDTTQPNVNPNTRERQDASDSQTAQATNQR